MLAQVISGALTGVDAFIVRVEVDLAKGLPCMHVVGLAESAVREGRERVLSALANSGLKLPPRRAIINLAPADLPKDSGRCDLPVALAILLASGQLSRPDDKQREQAITGLERYVMAGELSLTGAVVPDTRRPPTSSRDHAGSSPARSAPRWPSAATPAAVLPADPPLTSRAERAGAANTLVREEGGWRGDNTDGAGLVRDLTGRHGLDLRSRRTLLLGAGGGARGVAPALLDAGIGELVVTNRTPGRADALADALGDPKRVHSRYFEDLGSLSEFDLVVNATSAARDGAFLSLPRSLVGRRTAAVDLSYGDVAIGFLAWARAAGAHDVIDGLGMLVEQAAESFHLWHGVRPDTDVVYAKLRENDRTLVTAD